MKYVDYRISLDVRDPVSHVILNAKRRDSGRRICITLTEGTDRYPVAEGCTAVLSARKPDGNLVYNSCSVSEGIICCPVTQQMTAAPGLVECEIKLMNPAGTQLTGAAFYLAVEETVFDGTDLPGSASEYGVIASIMEGAQQALTQSRNVLQNTTAASEKSAKVLKEATAAVEEAEKAIDHAEHAAALAENSSEAAYNALQTAQNADRKVETLRQAVSGFHTNIACTAEGSCIHLDDSAQMPFQELTLYGKTFQNGTPSPESPVMLTSPGGSGELRITAAGKNLFSADNGLLANFTQRADVALAYPLSPGTYTVSAKVTSTDTDATVASLLFKGGSEDGTNAIAALKIGERSFATVTLYHSVDTLYAQASNSYANSAGDTATFEDLQIEWGNTATEYEPYRENILTLSMENGISGIPVSSGGNYTDAEGQQWVCDSVDLAKGVKVQRIRSVVFNGSESWYLGGDGKSVTTNISAYPAVSAARCLCSHYPWSASGTNRTVSIYSALNINDDSITTVDAWKEGLAADPITVKYLLKTPVETALSQEQLEAFQNLYACYPATGLWAEGAHMKLSYLADTKAYIDKKFDLLASALVSST